MNDEMLLAAYEGSGGFRDGGYLIPHPRESAEKFERRKQVSKYPNYTRKIVDTYLGYLFQRPPTRTGGTEAWGKVTQNADGAGRGLDAVMEHAERLALLLGTVFLVVDRPRGRAQTRADEARQPPYVVTRLPEEVAGHEMDGLGNLVRIGFSEARGKETVYRWFDRTHWWLSEDAAGEKGLDGERGEHGLGRVPVVRLHCADPLRPRRLRAAPWAEDIVALNFELFQARSELRELFRAQTFSILAMPIHDSEEAEALKGMTLSVENALTYNPEGGGKPGFIAPPSSPVELYLKDLEWTVGRLYELANLEFVGGVQQSGVAMGFHFQGANRTLAGFAKRAEAAEEQVAWLVHGWLGLGWEGSIAYPRDFAVRDLLQELQLAMDALSLEVSPTFGRVLKKRLSRDILGNTTDQETLDQIDREIEAGGDEYSNRIAQEAGGE